MSDAARVYLVYGEDEYRVTARTKALIDELVPEADRALGLEVVDAAADTVDEARKALASCFEALQTMGFFGSQKVVWFRSVSFFTKNVVGQSDTVKALVDKLAATIKDGLPEGSILVVSAGKVNKSYKIYKACKAAGNVEEFAISAKAWESEKESADFLRSVLRDADLTMSGNVGKFFLEKVGADSRHIVNEIEKLAVYMGDRKDVDAEDIDAVTCSSKTALGWDLVDAVGTRRLPDALKILRQLIFQRESAIGLLMQINGRIRDLLLYREAIDNGWLNADGRNARWEKVPADIENTFSEGFDKDPRKTHPFRMGLLAAQAKEFSVRELRRCQDAIVKTHRELVSGSVPQSIALELLLVRMLARPRKA
jgi:DNA polymerase-3 subunit delta